MKQYVKSVRLRGGRFLWVASWAIIGVVLCGWLALLPILMATIDLEFTK